MNLPPSLSMTTTIEDDSQESWRPKRLGGLTRAPALGLEFDPIWLKSCDENTPFPLLGHVVRCLKWFGASLGSRDKGPKNEAAL
jgi:hypothetical protein